MKKPVGASSSRAELLKALASEKHSRSYNCVNMSPTLAAPISVISISTPVPKRITEARKCARCPSFKSLVTSVLGTPNTDAMWEIAISLLASLVVSGFGIEFLPHMAVLPINKVAILEQEISSRVYGNIEQ
ncbi:MAG: hypothetical protein Q7K44_03510 [Candidatus Liptonbacteria bacterium]|nr:hypothetical protein [Candidatus Liptonbacteria bacterium]